MKAIITQFPDTCIFCKKSVTEKAFFSNLKFSAIYNLAPVLPGHTLIIPNIHYESLSQLSDTELADMMIFARKACEILRIVFKCEGFDWTIQDGVSAGQTVPHLHLHLIPRKPLDMPEGDDWYSKISENEQIMLDSESRRKLSEAEYDEITDRLSETANTMFK